MNGSSSSIVKSEDWMALWIGLFLFLLAFLQLAGLDLLGWAAKFNNWIDISKSVSTVSKGSTIQPILSVLLTYLFLLAVMSAGTRLMGHSIGKFIPAFTGVYWISYLAMVIGNFAYIAATKNDLAKFGISWSMNLTGEAGFIVALILGLIVGNFMTGFAEKLKDAILPEWYIKTAIVILGGSLGVKAVEAMGLASAIMFRGLCAIVEAYLIYWAVVYLIARTVFKFSREWAAPLASGISICGVSAAIATGGAIKARPIVPIMVSSLVVVFAVVELLVLPFIAQHFLYKEPMVAGAWMGLAVKTDGAAVASGAIADSLIRAKALAADGVNYKEGWILMTSTTIKVFIDVFIGVWAFILAIVWCTVIECKPGEKFRPVQIWERFPKFVIGYVLTFLILVTLCGFNKGLLAPSKAAVGAMDALRVIFFSMTFFAIGAVSNFKKLWEEGIGKLAAVYILCLFGFIIWVGLLISWIFFHGVKPPIV